MPLTNTTAAIFDFDGLKNRRPVLWTHDREAAPPPRSIGGIAPDQIQEAQRRFVRFAPLLAQLFPELEDSRGVIESVMPPVPTLQKALGIPEQAGALFVKADSELPVAGSVKARGGTHEVLEFAERLALEHGLITLDSDYRLLASPRSRGVFSRYTIAVGSTGNLGLAVGTMGAALGFTTVVHMSAEAKEWKKERLRKRGVTVVEHHGDYGQAVQAGRQAAEADPHAHFVDDERSASLFHGYATAAEPLARQLDQAGRRVDAAHPLFVYLPCGVGGAPGGIAYGLTQVFGPHVHCLYAEPVASPCFLVRMLAGSSHLPDQGRPPTVYDIGLDNVTEADGLAVPCASELAAAVTGPLIAGVYTVTDEALFKGLHLARVTETLRIEPSAAAGLFGPDMLLNTPQGRAYLKRSGTQTHLANATHVAWLTGGRLVPDVEYERFAAKAAALWE